MDMHLRFYSRFNSEMRRAVCARVRIRVRVRVSVCEGRPSVFPSWLWHLPKHPVHDRSIGSSQGTSLRPYKGTSSDPLPRRAQSRRYTWWHHHAWGGEKHAGMALVRDSQNAPLEAVKPPRNQDPSVGGGGSVKRPCWEGLLPCLCRFSALLALALELTLWGEREPGGETRAATTSALGYDRRGPANHHGENSPPESVL